jgi:hypothetical protein
LPPVEIARNRTEVKTYESGRGSHFASLYDLVRL